MSPTDIEKSLTIQGTCAKEPYTNRKELCVDVGNFCKRALHEWKGALKYWWLVQKSPPDIKKSPPDIKKSPQI